MPVHATMMPSGDAQRQDTRYTFMVVEGGQHASASQKRADMPDAWRNGLLCHRYGRSCAMCIRSQPAGE